jgi:hypothetical protein
MRVAPSLFLITQRKDIRMSTDNLQLARAAANLTEEDLQWVREHGPQITPDDPESSEYEDVQEASSEQEDSQELSSQEDAPEAKDSSDEEEEDRKRRNVEHEWPQVGTILEADYQGTRYEAEVISMPRYKSGRALRITTGPAAGEVERSMSGAMLTATEEKREENDLGRKGVSNGWEFWSPKEADDTDE